jgi:hypothetical protein
LLFTTDIERLFLTDKLRAHELSKGPREATQGVLKENTMIREARNPVLGRQSAASAINRSKEVFDLMLP